MKRIYHSLCKKSSIKIRIEDYLIDYILLGSELIYYYELEFDIGITLQDNKNSISDVLKYYEKNGLKLESILGLYIL